VESYYEIGVVHKVTIESGKGQIIEIKDAEVSVTVEKETLPHYSMVGGKRVVVSGQEISQNRKVEIKTREDVGEDVRDKLMRLIRED
jgi:hypothetical protein